MYRPCRGVRLSLLWLCTKTRNQKKNKEGRKAGKPQSACFLLSCLPHLASFDGPSTFLCKPGERRGVSGVRVRARLRKVFVQESGGEEPPLHLALDSAEVRGHYDLEIPAQAASAKGPARPARSARMEVRAATVWLPTPRRSSAYIDSLRGQRLRHHVVWAPELAEP